MGFRPLADTEWLKARLGEPGLVVVDCRWRLGEPGAGRRDWAAGHVPGAAHLDVDTELSDPPGVGGRHPLPATDRFEAAARRAGIDNESTVVAYDEAGEGGAARLWWLLRHFGHDRAAVLEGGLRAWREAGGPLRAGEEEVSPGGFDARPREGDVVSAEAVGRGGLVLLDARAPERYRGEVEPIDPVAGHVPGAVNVPTEQNLREDGTFRPAEELRAVYAVGSDGGKVAAYCGSGVTAAHDVLALAIAGVDAALYPGSWSEWVADPSRPVETG
jgi:thiosulfate/3-mercaptopyruvate sulfurtransferase